MKGSPVFDSILDGGRIILPIFKMAKSMTNSELISLFAVIITFLTTLVGWIFTYRSQRKTQQEIANLNEKFSIEREKRQQKLTKLNEMENWFNEGLKLSMDEMAHTYRKSIENLSSEPNILIRSYREQMIIWVASIAKYYALASEYDRIEYIKTTKDSNKEPKYQKLASFVMDFSAEVMKHIDEVQIFELNDILQKNIAADNKEQVQKVAQQIVEKGQLMGRAGVKKTMLAKQALNELNTSGRVSKKTQLALEDNLRLAEEMPPPP